MEIVIHAIDNPTRVIGKLGSIIHFDADFSSATLAGKAKLSVVVFGNREVLVKPLDIYRAAFVGRTWKAAIGMERISDFQNLGENSEVAQGITPAETPGRYRFIGKITSRIPNNRGWEVKIAGQRMTIEFKELPANSPVAYRGDYFSLEADLTLSVW